MEKLQADRRRGAEHSVIALPVEPGDPESFGYVIFRLLSEDAGTIIDEFIDDDPPFWPLPDEH